MTKISAIPFIHAFMTNVLEELKAAERCGYIGANNDYIRGYRSALAACDRVMRRKFEVEVIPLGYALVPIEPTPQMFASVEKIGRPRFGLVTAAETWAAMIAAAPPRPTQERSDEQG